MRPPLSGRGARLGEVGNSARYTFLNPRASEFLRDWDKAADDTVAILRAEAGRDPYDRNLSDLIGELSTHSEAFRARWASYDVRIHATGTKRLHHPVVGDLDLSYESFPPTAPTDDRVFRKHPVRPLGRTRISACQEVRTETAQQSAS